MSSHWDWDNVATGYDLQLPLERAALRAAAELAAPAADERLLDLGTGTGAMLRELARRPQRPAYAVGVDISSAMLARSRDLPDGWETRRADAREVPFPDASFHIVTAAYLLHILADDERREIVRECARVLKPQGRLVTVTPSWPRSRLARALYAPLAGLAKRSSGAATGLRPLDPRDEIAATGFEVDAVRYVGRGYPSLCVRAHLLSDGPAR